MALVVLDTNVLVAAVRSRRNASFQVLKRIGTGVFDVAVSVPLMLEYEDALNRHRLQTLLGPEDIESILDYVCQVAKHQDIYFLWRPLLRDPKDDLVAEVAVASGSDAIVTYNRRDFAGVGRFGMRVIEPVQLLREIGVLS
nr:putative toxin-antitoxin system toxin component, PIN family [Gammaproteobacteria bacterium]